MQQIIKNIFVVENELKEELALRCFKTLKKDLKIRSVKNAGGFITQMAERVIQKQEIDYEFTLLFSALYSLKYVEVEAKVESDPDYLSHMTTEDYWDKVGYNTGLEEAVIFVYTYSTELYPQATIFLRGLSQRENLSAQQFFSELQKEVSKTYEV